MLGSCAYVEGLSDFLVYALFQLSMFLTHLKNNHNYYECQLYRFDIDLYNIAPFKGRLQLIVNNNLRHALK